uniref:Uncharacterized protein n=1 Tax=Anguilla anguilla TaxID=7936 RepID=A0A0E9WGK7_ANGAN
MSCIVSYQQSNVREEFQWNNYWKLCRVPSSALHTANSCELANCLATHF